MESNVKRLYSAGGVVLNTRGEVLVCGYTGATWSLPKGKVEEGEDDLMAAKREIYEESGVKDLIYVKDLGSYERSPDEDGTPARTIVKTITLFLFTTDQMVLAPIDPENPDAVWLPVEEVSGRLSHPKDKEFFESILPLITL